MKTMKALLDTNIIIHREAATVVSQDIGLLYRWLDRGRYTKCVHSATIEEIKKNPNASTVSSFLVKLQSYEVIEISSPMQKTVADLSQELDKTDNDCVDSILLNEVCAERVDILISEDKGVYAKAERLGLKDKVFTIDSFLEKVFADNPELVPYKVLNVQKVKFGQIDLKDAFFDSLRADYQGFDKWFTRKFDDEAYVTINSNNGKLLSFLYLRVEGDDENYTDMAPPLPPKRRLKVGTFKVISNGFRLGERFLKIIFDNALKNHVQEIYVTIYDHRDEQRRLIDLLKAWGFRKWGVKGSELVYVRDFTPGFDLSDIKATYPYFSRSRKSFLVPIYPEYHTELLPDSILNTESPSDYVEDFPHRNCIGKVYVSWAYPPYPEKGDILVFYRTGGFRKSVVSTIGVMVDMQKKFEDEKDFLSYCRKASVFPEKELHKMWQHKNKRPLALQFLYVYSFPHRINMARLIELGILAGIKDAPRGFRPISTEQFNLILKETRSDESFIVD